MPTKAMVTNQTYPTNLVDHRRGPGQYLELRQGEPASASTPIRALGTATTSSLRVPTRFNSWTTVSRGAIAILSTGKWAPGTGSSSRRVAGPWRARCGRPGQPNPRPGCFNRRDGPTARQSTSLSGGFDGWESTDSFANVSVTTTSMHARYRQRGRIAVTADTGLPFTFSQAAASGTAPLTYAWSFGDGGTSTGGS